MFVLCRILCDMHETPDNPPAISKLSTAERGAGGLDRFRPILLDEASARGWRGYFFALVLVLAAALLRLYFMPDLGSRFSFLTFYPVIIIVGVYAGFRSGVLASALSVLAADFFWINGVGLGPRNASDGMAMMFFFVSCVLTCWVAETMRRTLFGAHQTKRQLLEQQSGLEALVKARTAALEQEIAERKRAEAILNEAQRIANVGSWEWEAVSGKLAWSAQMYVIHDFPSGSIELTDEAAFAMFHEDDRERVRTAFYSAVAHGTRYAVEGSVPTRHGLRTVRAEAEPVFGADGRVERMVGTVADISARKDAERALQIANAEAERANNAKSRFLAAASHDLRQPLSALTIYVDVLRRRAAPEDRPVLDNMKDCVGSLGELLSDLLDLSKLDAGVVKPQVAEFPIDDLLRSLVSMHAPEALLKGLRPRCVSSRRIARTDPVLLRRMLGNLLSNAIRYTERGGVLVGCRRRRGTVWVEVWDSGVGIPADKTAEIFEEFKQLGDEARSAPNRGSGLGLAIVAKTAALLGLQIRVRSWPGRGSMFAVELPLGEQPSLPVEHAPRAQALQVALVEDNVVVRDALVLALEAVGHAVVAAGDGASLLRRLADDVPDIVISDYRLGAGETGFDVIRGLRAKAGDDLPAILITGDTDPNLLRSMANRGIVVLHKPLDVDALHVCIGELTQQEAAAA
jgi:signal transduction histidine kinase/ActR/RegA family two-component response regulator